MIGYDNGNALLISSDYEFSGVGNTAYFTEHKNCGDYDSICHIVNSQDCIRKWEKRYYENQLNEIEYWIDFNHTLQGYWYFYEHDKSALDDDLLRGRNTIKTDKSLVLKRCIDKLLEGGN